MIFSGLGENKTEAASSLDLTNTALSYIGAPYKYGGTSIAYGLDCSAYTQFVFSKLGIQLERTSNGQYQQGFSVSKSNLQPGDLVFFNTSGRGISHVGIFIGNGKFVSATSSRGVAVASINDPYYWGDKYLGAKRVANFSDEQVRQVVEPSVDLSIYDTRGKVAKKLVEYLGLDTSDTKSPFPDISADSEYAGAATALYKIGAFTGDPEGKFNPNSPITRGELSKVLVVAFNLSIQPDVAQFNDVATSHWAYDTVSILSSNNVTVGIGNGLFGVKNNVRSVDVDAFIKRAMNLKN